MLDLKITALIIEKNKHELAKTLSVLKKISELSIVAKTANEKQGLTLVNNFVPQLIFINTDLSDTSGLELAHTIRSRNASGDIVFVANDSKQAFNSLSLEPFDFLVKPVAPELITRLILRLKQKLKKKELLRKMETYTKLHAVDVKRIFHQKKGIVILRLSEIVFCKSELTSTHLKLCSGESVKVKSKLGQTIEIINRKNFIRTGRSYYINREYLRKIDKKNLKCVLYYDGQTWKVPVSKNTIGMLEKLNAHPIY